MSSLDLLLVSITHCNQYYYIINKKATLESRLGVRCTATSRDLNRMDAVAASPIFSSFSEMLKASFPCSLWSTRRLIFMIIYFPATRICVKDCYKHGVMCRA